MGTSRIFEMSWSLNQYKAHFIESVQKSTSEYVAEVTYDEADYYHNGECSLKLYTNKETKDIQINKWTFPCIIKGKYHYPPQFKNTPQSIGIIFECIDPECNKQSFTIWNYEHWEQSDFAELYLNTLYLISNCSNIEEYYAIKGLKERNFKVYPMSIKDAFEALEQLLNVQNFIRNYNKMENAKPAFVNCIRELLKDKFNQLKQSLDTVNLEE